MSNYHLFATLLCVSYSPIFGDYFVAIVFGSNFGAIVPLIKSAMEIEWKPIWKGISLVHIRIEYNQYSICSWHISNMVAKIGYSMLQSIRTKRAVW